MRSTSKIWPIVSIISLITSVLLFCGFVYAIRDIENPSSAFGISISPGPASQEPAPTLPGQLNVAVIGDSLAKGTGDDGGKGFAERATDLLQEQNKKSKVQLLGNLGINGLTTSQLQAELREVGVQYTLKQANVILLSIGGNDLFQGAEEMSNGGDLPSSAQLNQAITSASDRFKICVQQIKAINPNATLVYIGLYNPFYDLPEMRLSGTTSVERWNSMALNTLVQVGKAVMIPTYDLFEINIVKYISSDHFHPNEEGYEQIAQRIVQSLG